MQAAERASEMATVRDDGMDQACRTHTGDEKGQDTREKRLEKQIGEAVVL